MIFPFDGAGPGREPHVSRPARDWDPLPADDITALADSISPRYRVMVWLGAGAGLREGEALGLTVPRVDFLRRRIAIRQQLQNGQLCGLKTRKSQRVVPVDDLVLAEISRHIQQWPARELLITNERGAPVSRSPFGRHWRDAVKAAGLPAGTRYHDLRHWYASCLIAGGISVKVVQDRLGHATATETLNVYSHLWPDDGELGRGVIDGMFQTDAGRQYISRT